MHHDLVAERLADVLEFGDQLARTLALGQRQTDVADAFAALGAFDAQLFEPAHAAFVAGAARLDALADPDFFLGQQLVEAGLLQALGFEPLRLALLPLRKIAGKAEQAAAVELDDAGRHRVEEAPVVGDDDGRALPVAQHGFQPCDAVEVQVVGRFVQQQQVGFVDQGARQRDALAHAAGQAGDRRFGRQSQAFERGPYARRPLPVFGMGMGVAHDVEHRAGFIQCGFLLDRGHAQARTAGDVAVVGLRAAIEQAQQRRFARAVAPDQADALAFLDGEIGVVQQGVVAVGQLNVGKRNKGSEGHGQTE
ncbi:Uncharacterised protein [Bordetella pertussis]|nr:Uncharacterised protein [Bordetella pertussis]CFN47805.1 Uncharacterised protein [Bordetella pertussis]CFN70300.1 Uncharacterised protein [Bordetella pertussis]CFO00876.1 Uncharacterised protein [Bordetella pertussis]CFO29759.1 Uncharacterised protein [Bordetella pertussis]